jgi:glucuronate isomerase
MKENFLLKTNSAQRLYESVRDLPIIDFHNHICVADIKADRKYDDIVSLWLTPDPYKHRLMRICGVDEHFITGEASPFEKFQKYCEIFPYLAGNPVYDWSRMELSQVFGIEDEISGENAKRIYDKANEKLALPEFSNNGILSRFNIEYQSPVATLLEDIEDFDGVKVAPSLRADDLLFPTEGFKSELSAKSGVVITDEDAYVNAICVLLDRFEKKGCRFADHSLDARFFKEDTDGKKTEMLVRLGKEYAKRGWTLLLHMNAKRRTSPRLLSIAGPAGGFAAAGESFDISAVADLLGKMEANGGLPDTVLFPLNMSDQAPLAVLHGSYSEDGVASKVQLGPAWWWCDHAFGIRNTLESIASFGVLSQFIGMTTDSRSFLSYTRHEYFRRIMCELIGGWVENGEYPADYRALERIVSGISYKNTKRYFGWDK